MHVGFTGDRYGMTREQLIRFCRILGFSTEYAENWFHHGDCVGADAAASHTASILGWKIHSHPPIKTDLRAFSHCDKESAPREYIPRNHDIVDETEFMIATPGGPEHQRSGTWATIRYAKLVGKRVVIIMPDGSNA